MNFLKIWSKTAVSFFGKKGIMFNEIDSWKIEY